jgi:2-iminoacetate synthase ThiH
MRCGVTGKVAFKTHEHALTRGGEILTEGSNRNHTPTEFRAYHCLYCGFYHLSGKQRLDKISFRDMVA